MADGAVQAFNDTPSDIAAPAGRANHPPEVWAAAQADYLAGLSGPEVCAKHGMRLGTLRHRTSVEGWRRADQRPPFDEGAELEDRVEGDLDRIEAHELASVARSRMMRAVLRGSAGEALRWKRVADLMQAEQDEADRWVEEEEALRRRLAATRDRTLQTLQTVFPALESDAGPPSFRHPPARRLSAATGGPSGARERDPVT